VPRLVSPARLARASHGYESASILARFPNRAIYVGLKTSDAIALIAAREQVHAALLAPG
jgi:hypothetical protein